MSEPGGGGTAEHRASARFLVSERLAIPRPFGAGYGVCSEGRDRRCFIARRARGAFVALARNTKQAAYVVIVLIVPSLPYILTQPVLRYRYISYGLSIFFAAELLGWALRRRRLLTQPN